MNFKMTKPCDNCPFRTEPKFYLRRGRVIEIVQALRGGGTFACHKTVDYETDEGRTTEESEMCAGAMILLEKDQDPERAPSNQMLRIAERLGFYHHEYLDMDAPVFDSFQQMIEEAG